MAVVVVEAAAMLYNGGGSCFCCRCCRCCRRRRSRRRRRRSCHSIVKFILDTDAVCCRVFMTLLLVVDVVVMNDSTSPAYYLGYKYSSKV